MNHRFFVDAAAIEWNEISIVGSDAAHIRKVLRLRPGDEITVCDGQGTEYVTKITELTGSRVLGRIVTRRAVVTEPLTKVTLFQGLPKGDKMDYIVQKCTELGIADIVPIQTERSVVRLAGAKANQRQERWQRIAEEAAKQAGRGYVPRIWPVANLEAVLGTPPAGAWEDTDLILIPWEEERKRGLKDLLRQFAGQVAAEADGFTRRVAVFIGPEGGFASREVASAIAIGAVPVTLGPRILRTETAGLIVLSMILYECGDLGQSLPAALEETED